MLRSAIVPHDAEKGCRKAESVCPNASGRGHFIPGAVRVASDCPVLAVTGSGVSQLRDSRPAQRYCEPASGKAPS